jgi:hypothetical protein
MRVVQVRVSRAAFADALGAMRSWLDRNNRPLVRFETATENGTILVNVQFDDDALAEAFRQDFNGEFAG